MPHSVLPGAPTAIIMAELSVSATFPRKRFVHDFTSRFRGNQRKGRFVNRFGDVISTGWPESFCYERVCLLRWRGWSSGWAVCGHAGGRPGERGRAAEMRRCAGAARGSCARRSSSGLGVPAAFNRAGEGPRAGRGELPWVSGEVVLNVQAGSLPPWGNGLWCSRGPLLACAWLAAWPAVMRPWRGGGRARRRRSGHPIGCRAPSATRSSAAATRRTPHGPVRG